ncbi:MAG: hypothetical protein HRU20_32065 [Pseudomonadales bacterium]|nr:hypothetical protein [Pseudomonadales bacterium]
MHRVKKGAKWLSITLIAVCVMFFASALFLPNHFLIKDDVPKPCANAVVRLANMAFLETEEQSKDICLIRDRYYQQLEKIPQMDRKMRFARVPLNERAFCAFAIHHQSRMMVREQMSLWPLMVLRLKDFYIYGNFHGPDFDHLLQGEIHIHLNDYYERLITKAQDSDLTIDKMCQKKTKPAMRESL